MKPKYGVVLTFELNRLARVFYMMQGYQVPEGYDFSKAKHPMEKLMWAQADIAYKYFSKERK